MPQHTRPNVLLVVADQMRRDALGLNRPAFVHTPHLDQLARECVNLKKEGPGPRIHQSECGRRDRDRDSGFEPSQASRRNGMVCNPLNR